MEIISILLSVMKLFALLFVLIIVWKLYEFLYIPWATRKRYSKYRNFAMIDKYHPMLGDIVEINNNQNENKFKFQHYIEIAQKKPDLDFYLVQLAQFQYVLLCSIKSFNEFEDLLPSKIDRHNHEGHLLKNVLDRSFSLLPSNSNWNERRKVVMKTIGINFASQYIQLMISIVDDWAKNLPKDTEMDLNFELNKITFNIMTRILFGRDFDKMKNCRYVSPKDGSTTDLCFQDCYFRYARDEFEAQFDSKGKLIPFLEKYKLVDPYKTIEVNKLAIEDVLREFLETSTDDQSVYRQVLNSGSFTKEEVFYDTKLLLFAGFDTTSHGVSSMLYYLYKYPNTLSKLMEELKTKGVNSLDPNQGSKLKDLYESCDYLNYVIKEGLRIDPPGTGSMFYVANDKVTICDVEFDRGTVFSTSQMIPHFNPKIWQNPNEFIPERFDPESMYYFMSGDKNESRNPKSYLPFSFGMRNCAGQTLAKIESKIILSRILTKLDIKINQDQLDNEFIKFNLYSQYVLKGKVYEK